MILYSSGGGGTPFDGADFNIFVVAWNSIWNDFINYRFNVYGHMISFLDIAVFVCLISIMFIFVINLIKKEW